MKVKCTLYLFFCKFLLDDRSMEDPCQVSLACVESIQISTQIVGLLMWMLFYGYDCMSCLEAVGATHGASRQFLGVQLVQEKHG